MKKDKSELILHGNLYSVIITLAIPIMVNSLIQTLYNVVDGIWVSKIGSTPFAAISFVSPVNGLFVAIGMGLSIAGTAIISRKLGAKNYELAETYATQLMGITALSGVVFASLGYVLTPLIVELMGASAELAEYSIIYLRITLLDIPFMFLFFNFNSIMVSQGNTVTPTVLSMISAILNCILDPIFMFTMDLGIAGAALATLVSKALLGIAGFIILMKGKSIIRPVFKRFKFDIKIIGEIFKIAVPTIVGQSGASLGFIVLNGFIASYGTATMAAFGMVNRITSLVLQPSMGVGAALTSVIGQNLGNSNIDRAKEAFKKAINITLFISIIGGTLMIVFDQGLINIFMQSKDDMEVINQGLTYLRYVAFCMPLMGIFSVFQGVFQGSGHTKYSMFMEIGRLWCIRIPMILIFKYFTNIDEEGIWIAMNISNVFVCIYGYMIYRRGGWQRKIIR